MKAAPRASRSARMPGREDRQAIQSQGSMTASGALRDLCAHTKKQRVHAIGTLSAIAVVSVQAPKHWSRDSCPDQCLSEAQEPQRRGFLYAKGAVTSFNAQERRCDLPPQPPLSQRAITTTTSSPSA